jgi:hypothetical protein
MVLTKLDAVFKGFLDKQDAANSFFPGRRTVPHYDILEWVREQKELPAHDLAR